MIILGIRFTPTCVGTMISVRSVGILVAVHPHVRGDNGLVTAGRTRHQGFTPTCVGTIAGDAGWPDNKRGSPPRAWGQLAGLTAGLTARRFTPTCVGTIE